MKKYPPIEPGQRVKIPWRKEDYKMACCDCGLVHRLRFKVLSNSQEIVMQAWRDNRATAQLRRHRHSENDEALPQSGGEKTKPKEENS